MKNGLYEMVLAPEAYPGKKYRGRYVYEHHLVWWQNTGNLVRDGYVIHHVNEKKRDNRFENLQELLAVDHSTHHSRDRSSKIERVQCVCAWCEFPFELLPGEYKHRSEKYEHLHCSVRCSVRHQMAQGKHRGYKLLAGTRAVAGN